MKFFDLQQFISNKVTKRAESLLTNDLKKYQQILSEKVNGSAVLVIGGAGTIGSSYIKALLKFKPRKLVVVDTNENGLTELIRDLRSSVDVNIPEELITYPVNFGSETFLKLVRHHAPFDIVASFAAHKHVRSEKDQFSIEAMVHNNVISVRNLLELLTEFPPKRFFSVSTDKAANPVNVMGATKKLMEDVMFHYSDKIHITTARFANVAFSNGSLPIGFMERIMKKQPLSAPSDVKRYFVSPQESGELCLLACMIPETGRVVFPRLDSEKDTTTFSVMAEDLLEAMGMEPDYCDSEDEAREKAHNLKDGDSKYPVAFFKTDTSGEKMYEEFFVQGEDLDLETFSNLGIINNANDTQGRDIQAFIKRLKSTFQKEETTKKEIVDLINGYLPNFSHIEKGKGLDSKM